MIYFDSAATSYYRPESVALAVAEAVRHMGNSSRGLHGASLDASRTIYEVREKLGNMFGCGTSQIVFTSNVTESLNTVLCGLLRPGDPNANYLNMLLYQPDIVIHYTVCWYYINIQFLFF